MGILTGIIGAVYIGMLVFYTIILLRGDKS